MQVKDYNEEFCKYFNEMKEFCERNKKIALEKLTVQSETSKDVDGAIEEGEGDGESGDEESEKQLTKTKTSEDEVEKSDKAVNEEPTVPNRKNFELGSKRRRRPRFKMTRSSSLTCAEMVEDLNVGFFFCFLQNEEGLSNCSKILFVVAFVFVEYYTAEIYSFLCR